MAIKIELRINGDKETVARLKKAGVQLNDFSEEFKSLSNPLLDYFSNSVFETEGQIFGEPWPKLKPEYEFRKRVVFPGAGILVASGDMKKAYRARSSSDFLQVYNPTEYFKYHHSDAPRTSKLPRRIMLKFDEERIKMIISTIEEGLFRRIRGVFK